MFKKLISLLNLPFFYLGVENFWILVLYKGGSSLIDPLIADWALYTRIMKLIITVIRTKYMVSSLEITITLPK